MTLPKTLERYRHMILSFEKQPDGTGYAVWTKTGWINEVDGVHDVSEATIRECAIKLSMMTRCGCDACKATA
jgi:hypothetical protein